MTAFRQAIVSRPSANAKSPRPANREATPNPFASEKARNAYAAAQTDALTGAEQTRRRLQTQHEENRRKNSHEYRKAKEKILKDYSEAKANQETDFRESRWTTTTVYEADKRTAKEQMSEAMSSCKTILRKLLADWQAGRKLVESLEFLEGVPPLNPKEVVLKKTDDPWKVIQQAVKPPPTCTRHKP